MPKYELKTFQDFLSIPTDRLETCLNEFKDAVITASLANEFAKALGDPNGVEFKEMSWNDDGKEDLTVTLHLEESK